MAASPFASKEHLDQCDLGADFTTLIETFMVEVDRIGFRPDPESPLYEICDNERLLPAVQPLLDHLGFKASATCSLETQSNSSTGILGHSARRKSRPGRDKEPYWCPLPHCASDYRCPTNLRNIATSWTQFISQTPIYGAAKSGLSSSCTSTKLGCLWGYFGDVALKRENG
jgi:hypothetical protein